MKTTTVVSILIGASAANAAAVADAEAQFCQLRGQSCWKVKRAAEAFAEAVASVGSAALPDGSSLFVRRSLAPGGLANHAIRALDGLAGVVASTQHNPRSYYSDLLLSHYYPAPYVPVSGDDDHTEAKRSADADADADPQFCQLRGQSCWRKRAADAAPEPEPEAEAQFCQLRGQSCWKVKRAAEAVLSTIEGFAVAKREALPEAEANADADADAEAQFCQLRGQSCWKAKRDAEAAAAAQFCQLRGQSCWKAKRAADAAADAQFCPAGNAACLVAKRGAEATAEPQFCQLRGQSCWKKRSVTTDEHLAARCYAPGGSCASATRDLHAMYNAARSVLESLPSQ